MDFKFSEKEEALRQNIREFAKKELPPNHFGGMFDEERDDESWAFSLAMSKKLSQRGWLTMAWPKEYGGQGATLFEQLVYGEECGYWGIPGTSMGISGVGWVGPVLMLFGTEEQKKKYIPQIASGEPDGVWCTGYSEPNAGSDFAALQTKAVRNGDEYIINGQKIWTSVAHRSRWCWLAARTDQNAPKKHQGISLMIVDMKSPGIEVRPLLNYGGQHFFNEVFFDNVRVPVANLVGEENRGWYQLMQALAYERGSVGAGLTGSTKRILEEIVNYTKETQYDGKPLSQNPIVRQKLAERAIEAETMRLFAYQTIWKMSQGVLVTYEPARDKAWGDIVMERAAITGTEIIGAYSQLHGDTKWDKIKGTIQKSYLSFQGMKIAAGTSEIQKNIIGQFALNLPKSY